MQKTSPSASLQIFGPTGKGGRIVGPATYGVTALLERNNSRVRCNAIGGGKFQLGVVRVKS